MSSSSLLQICSVHMSFFCGRFVFLPSKSHLFPLNTERWAFAGSTYDGGSSRSHLEVAFLTSSGEVITFVSLPVSRNETAFWICFPFGALERSGFEGLDGTRSRKPFFFSFLFFAYPPPDELHFEWCQKALLGAWKASPWTFLVLCFLILSPPPPSSISWYQKNWNGEVRLFGMVLPPGSFSFRFFLILAFSRWEIVS